MNKLAVFSSHAELSALRQTILTQAEEAVGQIRDCCSSSEPLFTLRQLKFEPLIQDQVFGERLNFIEYLNQTFTYLVCLYAGAFLLSTGSPQGVKIAFGVQPGYDVTSLDGSMLCECFSATSVKSNQKLKKDVLRLHQNEDARKRFVFFYTPQNEQDYVSRIAARYPDVALHSLSFAQLTADN